MRLALFALLGCACAAGATSAPKRERVVFCHYLPWFTLDRSADNAEWRRGWYAAAAGEVASQKQYVGAGPLIGEYSQRDAAVLEYHLLLAQAAGIDAFLININPSSALQVEVATGLFAATAALHEAHPDAFGVKLAISYDNVASTTQAALSNDFATVSMLVNLHGGSVTFVDNATNGTTVFLWSENAPELAYATAKAALGADTTVLARNPRAFAASDGNFAWVLPLRAPNATQLHQNWGGQYLKDFEWGMSNHQANNDSANRLSVGAVYPGFDDTNVPVEWNGGTPRQLSRKVAEGNTLDLTWEHALSYAPQRYGGPTDVRMPWVQMITWNDFPEGTAIEPNAGAGGIEAYQASWHFASRWHGIDLPEVSASATAALSASAVGAAQSILAARRSRDSGIATAVGAFLNRDFAKAKEESTVALPSEKDAMSSADGKHVDVSMMFMWLLYVAVSAY